MSVPARSPWPSLTFGVVFAVSCAAAWAPPAVAGEPVRMAVSYFENTSEDPALAPLRKGLAEMLITDLSVSDEIVLVERSRLEELLGEIELQTSPYFDASTAAEMGRGLGASYIVTGSYLVQPPAIRIDARVIDVESAEIALSVKAEGQTADVLSLQSALAGDLLEGIGAGLSLLDRKRIGAAGTRSYEALFAYSAGVDRLDGGDAAGALQAAEQAIAIDPSFAAAAALRERVDELLQAFDVNRHADRIARVAEHLAADACPCAYREPAPDGPAGARMGRRILPVMNAISSGPMYWNEWIKLPGAMIELGLFEEAEAFLAVYLSEDFQRTPGAIAVAHAGWIETPVQDVMVHAATCVGYQLASLSAYRQLQFDRAMQWQLQATELPAYEYKEMCLSGFQLEAAGVHLDQPLAELIPATMDDPDALAALTDRLTAARAIAPQVRERIAEIHAASDCATLCAAFELPPAALPGSAPPGTPPATP